jgi:cell wall-associated NlpC family hydrolase
MWVLWQRRWARYTVLALPALAALVLVMPGGPVQPEALRSEYLRQMARYKGSTYVWGGEGRLGIDCSGLVRRGLLNANVKLGVARLNPRLLRRALGMWWFDSSAKALRDGYRGQTRLVVEADSLNEFDHEGILPGDLACTQDGRHVLAYIGDRTWISASGGRLAMDIRAEPPNEGWFSVPVKIVRWTDFPSTGLGTVGE